MANTLSPQAMEFFNNPQSSRNAFLASVLPGMAGHYTDPSSGKFVQQLAGRGDGADGTPNQNTGYAQYTPRPDGQYELNKEQFEFYNPQGGFERMVDFKPDKTDLDTWGPMVVGLMAGAGAMGFLGGGGAGATGAVGSGAGFVGEGAASGIAGWDAALASSPSWSAAGGMTAGAGAANGSWDVAGSLGSAGSGGAGGAGGAGASLGGGVVPPNPYLSTPSLGSAIKSGLGSIGSSSGGGGFDWASLAGPAASLAGGIYSASQTGKAADAQLQAAREAQAMFKPWIDAGGWAIGQGANMLGKNGAEAAKNAFTQDPGYQWRLEQGNKAIERNAAARGNLYSGKYLKDMTRFNQGEASQEFGNSFNRLMSVAGMGQTATGSGADYRTQGANAQAAGIIGRGNAITDGISQGLSMYSNNRLMDQLLRRA